MPVSSTNKAERHDIAIVEGSVKQHNIIPNLHYVADFYSGQVCKQLM